MTNQAVPILVYHHVYTDETVSKLKPSAGIIGQTDFRRQLQYLTDNNWTVVSTDQIINWLLDGATLPKRAVALHFDNGWLDTYTMVMPILREFDMKGMCFVITDGLEEASLGRPRTVRTLTEGIVENPFMNWDQVEELLAAGWEIGAHTATHCKMANKYASAAAKGILWEIETSNALLEKHLGFIPPHFAYPSGSRNQQTDKLLAPYYRSLRLWHNDVPPITWKITDRTTSRLAIDCQNIDARVPFADFQRIFAESAVINPR